MLSGEFVTMAEAGRLLGLTSAGVRKAVQVGRLAPVRLSARVVLVPRAEVERYKRERRPRGRPLGRAVADGD